MGMISNGNNIYIAENGASKISKIDVSPSTPTATAVITGIDAVLELLLNGNDLNNAMGSDNPKTNGEGFTDKYTGNDISREDLGNEFTDWSWDISDYLDNDDNESDKSK